ncbi:hypothetical protein TIFTF001_048487 [Ficus carica]|uniref:Secreted protein n=1 Tax=Ficus carica TaxID=3494 RepID=A0AA88CUB4_FICCA|nr:hypothetical protein TIFTF001_048487 [Ficus carica]
MWWSAILALASQVSKARSMTCPFLVMAGHMCRVMVVLASQEPRWWPAMWSLCGETWLVLASQVSNLPTMLDARLWRDDTTDCEIWVGYRHGFWKYVM